MALSTAVGTAVSMAVRRQVTWGVILLLVATSSVVAADEHRIRVIVTLAERVDLPDLAGADKHTRRARLVAALRAGAKRTQGPLLERLRAGGATDVQPLWIINGVAATVSPALARAILRFKGVVRVAPDVTLRAPAPTAEAPARDRDPAAGPEWNIAAVAAPSAWSLGCDGAGAVVANMDTGVDREHPELKSKWRGGADSWWDPYRATTTPYDAIGHGTQTMGIMVGGSGGGTAIGVAPGAQWIAAKIYDDDGNTTAGVIHRAFQWLLAPGGVGGAADAPDVVNASWGVSAVNRCDATFERDFEALRAAGIVVVFGAGNSGPGAATSISPANNPDALSAGAVDRTDTVAPSSSRGPSACTGGIFPDTVAPGVDVKTADLSLGGVPQYTVVSGTSFAAPHLAGVAALLAGAFPAASVADIERTLRGTARDLGPVGPDDDYGYGLVDASAACSSLSARAAPARPGGRYEVSIQHRVPR